MSKIYVLYSGRPTYKRVLVRRVSWWRNHWMNSKFYFKPNFMGLSFWFWNLQFLFFGTEKHNGAIRFRFLNYELEIGW